MIRSRSFNVLLSLSALVLLVTIASMCAPKPPERARAGAGGASDIAVAAQATYVAPGDLDEYYMFSSGGHSGQIYVYGLPSMRHLSTIPVFTPYPATGYGFDDDSKKMLGNLTWGDAHHPALSETKGEYDGRWLFINDMNGRVARIAPRQVSQHLLGVIVEPVSRGRIRREHGNRREMPHRRDAIDVHLPGVTAGREEVILVQITRGDVGLLRRHSDVRRSCRGLFRALGCRCLNLRPLNQFDNRHRSGITGPVAGGYDPRITAVP